MIGILVIQSRDKNPTRTRNILFPDRLVRSQFEIHLVAVLGSSSAAISAERNEQDQEDP